MTSLPDPIVVVRDAHGEHLDPWAVQRDLVALAAAPVPVLAGSGSPETVVVASPGRLYVDLNGGAGTTLYVKETGTGNVGWIAK